MRILKAFVLSSLAATLAACSSAGSYGPTGANLLTPETRVAVEEVLPNDTVNFISTAEVWDNGARGKDFERRVILVTEDSLLQLQWDKEDMAFEKVHAVALGDIVKVSDGPAMARLAVFNIQARDDQQFRVQIPESSGPSCQAPPEFDGSPSHCDNSIALRKWLKQGQPVDGV